MSAFDPYHKWLGIPPGEQPAHHYRLLGVAPFESDPDVIESAADRQMAYVRQCASGPYVKESQQVLNELSAARMCLLNPSKKQAYDAELKARLGGTLPPPPVRSSAASDGPLADFKLSDIRLAEPGRSEKSPARPAAKPKPSEEKKPGIEKKKSAPVRAAPPADDGYEVIVHRAAEPEIIVSPRRRARKKSPVPLKALALAGAAILAVIVVLSFKAELADLLASLSKPGAEAQRGPAAPARDRNSPNRASARQLSPQEADLDYKRRQELLLAGSSRGQTAAPAAQTGDRSEEELDDAPDDPQSIPTEWTAAEEWLISSAAPLSMHSLPGHPPDEFVVSLRVRRLTGKNTFAIGLPVGGRQVLVALDAHAGAVGGLEYVDGKTVDANEAALRRRFLLPDHEVTIRCTVSNAGITCKCDDATVVDWRGDLARLSLPPDFSGLDEKSLFLATIGSQIAVRDIRIWRLGSAEPASTIDRAERLAGYWQTDGGDNLGGLTSRYEIKKANGKWSMKVTFMNRAKRPVGLAFGEECRFSNGTLYCIQRYKQKPVATWVDGLPVTFRLEPEDFDRARSTWSNPANGSRGGGTLHRAKAK